MLCLAFWVSNFRYCLMPAPVSDAAPSEISWNCFQSNTCKHVSFCSSTRYVQELFHPFPLARQPNMQNRILECLHGAHSLARDCLPVRLLLPAGLAAGCPASSAFYPAPRFSRRVDAIGMDCHLITNDLLASFRKIAIQQVTRR